MDKITYTYIECVICKKELVVFDQDLETERGILCAYCGFFNAFMDELVVFKEKEL